MFPMQLCQQLLFFSLTQACNCSTVGSLDSQCDVNTGQCNCHPKFSGMRCSECNRGHWNYPHCSLCECFLPGTDATSCDSETKRCSCSDQTGQCTCKVRGAETLWGKPSFAVESVTQFHRHSVFYSCFIKQHKQTFMARHRFPWCTIIGIRSSFQELPFSPNTISFSSQYTGCHFYSEWSYFSSVFFLHK